MGTKSETRVFRGVKYYRYPKAKRASDRTYFKRCGRLMHRDVWVHYNGPIPDGFEVHHKDGDGGNNEIGNLELVTRSTHARRHVETRTPKKLAAMRAVMDRLRPLAAAWHKSEAGRAWHSQHAKTSLCDLPPKQYRCDHCGTCFESRKRARVRYCSNNCRADARRKSGVDNETRRCEVCGVGFDVNKYKPNRTCSRKCGARVVPAR